MDKNQNNSDAEENISEEDETTLDGEEQYLDAAVSVPVPVSIRPAPDVLELVQPTTEIFQDVVLTVSEDTDLTLEAITQLISRVSIIEQEAIVPDVIDVVPEEIAQIIYPGDVEVRMGEILTPAEVKNTPSVEWNCDENAFYTICMTDPDAPSPENPESKECHHWLVGNIPGSDVSNGEVLSEYIGAAPTEGSGLHRFVFLVYKQEEKIAFEEETLTDTSPSNRRRFSSRDFAEKYNLGNPVAANFFLAEYDETVPEIFQQLGGPI